MQTTNRTLINFLSSLSLPQREEIQQSAWWHPHKKATQGDKTDLTPTQPQPRQAAGFVIKGKSPTQVGP